MKFIKLNKLDMSFVLDYLKKNKERIGANSFAYVGGYKEPPHGYSGRIMDGLMNGQYYLVRINRIDAGIFRLRYECADIWGQRDDKAGYIHSLVADSHHGGGRLACEIIDEIEQFIKDEECTYLRLDCPAQDKDMLTCYKSHGFKEVDEAEAEDEELILLERKIISETTGEM